jgi:hypothetical protein
MPIQRGLQLAMWVALTLLVQHGMVLNKNVMDTSLQVNTVEQDNTEIIMTVNVTIVLVEREVSVQ